MKKTISILLTILLLINSGGFIVIFYNVQNTAKSDMLLSIRSGNYSPGGVVTFRIRKKDPGAFASKISWIDKNEFEYDGKLYDIIKTDPGNDHIILYCLNDTTEEKLVKSFNDELNNLVRGDSINSIIKTSLLNLISQALIENSNKMLQSSGEQEYGSIQISKIPNVFIKIPFPPPKLT